MTAIFLLVLTLAAIGAVASALWPPIRDAVGRENQPAGAGQAAAENRRRDPESLEGALAAQLAVGEITRRQYLHAMERLAARDNVRNPLVVPPEAGSDA